LPSFLEKDAVLKGINQAQYRDLPGGFKKLSEEEIAAARRLGYKWEGLPGQERGTRLSCALPYALAAEGRLSADGKSCALKLESFPAFGGKSAGSPFILYVNGKEMAVRNYAVKAGDSITDHVLLEDGRYDLQVYGPNGWYREIRGSKGDPALGMRMVTTKGKCSLVLEGGKAFGIKIIDNAYGAGERREKTADVIDLRLAAHRWYDFTVRVEGFEGYERRFAGRVETGEDGISDPAMA
jgi:phospholipase C